MARCPRSALAVVLAAAALGCDLDAGDRPPGDDGPSGDAAAGAPPDDLAAPAGVDAGPPAPPSISAAAWLTSADGAQLLAAQPPLPLAAAPVADLVIAVDAAARRQVITGFGASLTDSSAWILSHQMSDAQRAAAMAALFGAGDDGLRINLLRQPMGTSDLALSYYSYDDLPAGQTDPQLTSFSIARDQAYIIPMLAQARLTNPALLVMATPWSAPAWMKSNGTLGNTGSLIDPTAYPIFAQYFVRFVQAYEAAGIPIWAVSPVNEPLIQPVAYPSMSMQWYQQANFVRYHLGPAFAAAGIGARILVFDHNWNDASFPEQLLDDSADVRGFTDGVAFHCYGGDPSMMDLVHDAHPDVALYVTECSGGVWSGSFGASLRTQFRRLYIGSLRHWAQAIVRWNVALDEAHGPYPATGGHGCTDCVGLITVHGDGSFTREVDYWAMAHLSRFVAAGAHRVDSNSFDGDVEDVAFVNPDGGRVLVVLNAAAAARRFAVTDGGRGFVAVLPAGAAATYTWH